MKSAEARMPLNCVDTGLFALSAIKEYPHFHWVLKVAGEVDPVLLGRAVLSTLHAHPNLRTRVHGRYIRPFRRIEEPREEDIVSFIDLNAHPGIDYSKDTDIDRQHEDALAQWINKPIDPTRQFPVRVLLLKKDRTESCLVFNFAHSSVDGIRSLRFMREVFGAYEGREPTESPLSRGYSSKRGDELLEIARSQRAMTKGFRRKMLASILHRVFAASLDPPTRIFHDRSGQSNETGYCFGVMEPGELRQIRSVAKEFNVKVNDVLLASCFRVIEKWNSLHGRGSGKIAIMVPIDIGTWEYMDLVSNQLSFISLPTRSRDRANPAILLQKVGKDMASMIRNGISFSILYFLHYASYLPLPIIKATCRLIMLTRVYADTILLSNLGVIWPESWGDARIGNSRIVDMNLVMPAVSPMGLSLGIHTFEKRLHVSLSYKIALFSREKAQRFLDIYLQELRSYALIGETGPQEGKRVPIGAQTGT